MDTPRKYPIDLLEAVITGFEESGAIGYGAELQWPVIEEAFGIKRLSEMDHGWEFRSVFMTFGAMLMDRGFKLSAAGMNKTGVRILQKEEMADHVLSTMRNQSNKNLSASIMLSRVPQTGMDTQEATRLENASIKAAFVGATMKRMLGMRKLPATPEMARRIAQKAIHTTD